jgi:hypothetical protein
MTPEGWNSGAIGDVHCRQRLGKHVLAATNTQETIEELLETVFSVGSAPRLYNEHSRPAERITEKRCQRDSSQLSVGIEGTEKGFYTGGCDKRT